MSCSFKTLDMKTTNLLKVLINVLLWGSSFALIKLGLDQTPPITLAFIRFAMASPLLLIYTYFKKPSSFKKSLLQDWKMFFYSWVNWYYSSSNISEYRITVHFRF
jgi:drug/metabolite transporter (DMT)-like permease